MISLRSPTNDENEVVFRFVSHSSSGTRPSLESKVMGASGCLEARPNEDRAPLMHMIEEQRRENEPDSTTL